MTTEEQQWLVSVDDHVLEPADLWQDRVPAVVRDRAPRLVVEGKEEFWVYDDKKIPTLGLSAVAGIRPEDITPNPIPYSEMRPGCYDPMARVKDMDVAGILASMCFPSVPRFCGQIFHEARDKDLAMTCLRVYNDWMIDEWCGAAPGRFIPLTLIPLWDPHAAADEMYRCADKGSRAIAFSENPAPLGLPTVHDPNGYWDPVLAAAADAELVVCMHVGSSSVIPKISPDSPFLANLAWGATRTSGTMLSWLFSGHFERFPALKIALSEGGIGWIPFFLERAEQVLHTQRHWATKGIGFAGPNGDHPAATVDLMNLDLRASFREHIFGCFIDDIHGLANIDVIGHDNVMYETDYPHSDGTWPDSITLARERLASLPEDLQYKVLRGNAERLFRFTPATL